MKRILKGNSPKFFEDWKRNFEIRNSRKPNYKFDFKGDTKSDLKRELLKEQGYLCCYCMDRVLDESSHIEHFIPQVHCRDKDLDYSNMFVSCNGYTEELWDDHCGHRKDNWYDSSLMLSPTSVKIDESFEYTIDGHIFGKNVKAIEMIAQLGLDSYDLNRKRKAALEASEFYEEFTYDDDEINRFIESYETKVDDCYTPFCNVIIYNLIYNY